MAGYCLAPAHEPETIPMPFRAAPHAAPANRLCAPSHSRSRCRATPGADTAPPAVVASSSEPPSTGAHR